jgi:lipopolysaccharide biosynthesis glycosyltransferase
VSEIHVAIATDVTYVPWAATAIRSALDATSTPIVVHLLAHDTFPSEEALLLTELARAGRGELVVHRVPEPDRPQLDGIGRFGTAVWLRFLLPELLPDIDRVLYLDADTFVTENLAELMDTDLGGLPLGAVRNVVEPAMFPHVASLGIGSPRDLFNSGVLLMDLNVMRREGSSSALVSFAAENAQRLRWPDQDALNVVFAGRWHALHPRYNAMNSLWTWTERADEVFGPDVVREAIAHPAILHFEGPIVCKPWHYLCPHPWRGRYRQALAATPWADTPLEDRTPATRAISLLPPAWQLPVYWRLVGARRRARSARRWGRTRRLLR